MRKDTYNGTDLTLSLVLIGGSTYSDMTVTFGHIVSGPAGATSAGSADSCDPGNNQLTVPTVAVGAATYHNLVITVASRVSPGNHVYSNVVVKP